MWVKSRERSVGFKTKTEGAGSDHPSPGLWKGAFIIWFSIIVRKP